MSSRVLQHKEIINIRIFRTYQIPARRSAALPIEQTEAAQVSSMPAALASAASGDMIILATRFNNLNVEVPARLATRMEASRSAPQITTPIHS